MRWLGGELHGRRLLKHGLAAQSLVSPYDVHANDIADIVRVHHRYQVSDVVDVNAPQPNDDIARLNPGDGGWLLRITAVTNTPGSTGSL